MQDKIDARVAIAGFGALAVVLAVEVLLIVQHAAPMLPSFSPLARFVSRIMFGH